MHSRIAAAMVVIVATALVADCAWARGRGGHSGGKRGGGGHAGAAHGGAHAGAGARMAAGRPAGGGGGAPLASRATAAGGNAGVAAARQAAGAPAAAGSIAGASGGGLRGGGGRAFAVHGGGFFGHGYPRADGRYFGHPVARTGALVGIAAFWAIPPPGYPPPVVVVPYVPSEYIEMGPDERPVVTPPQGYWYFCPDASEYYPHVQECPDGWELVAPPGMMPTG